MMISHIVSIECKVIGWQGVKVNKSRKQGDAFKLIFTITGYITYLKIFLKIIGKTLALLVEHLEVVSFD